MPQYSIGIDLGTTNSALAFTQLTGEAPAVNLQAIPAMAEGALLADVIAGGASLDPVMGGCDR